METLHFHAAAPAILFAAGVGILWQSWLAFFVTNMALLLFFVATMPAPFPYP